MKPPTSYYGGKIRLADRIVSLMPAHSTYIEPFFGTGAVFFARPTPARVEVINDLDDAVVAFFRCLRDRPDDLVRACALSPYARAEYQAADLDDPTLDDIERARRWWVRVRQGLGKSGRTRTGWSITVARTLSPARVSTGALDRFHQLAERLASVQIEHKPAADVIRDLATRPDVLVYADPPYLASTRVVKTGGDYRVDMTDEASHRHLADVLNATPAAVLLSGYPSPLYDQLYAEWHRVEIHTTTTSANTAATGKQRAGRTEVVWSNRPLPNRLFDPATLTRRAP